MLLPLLLPALSDLPTAQCMQLMGASKSGPLPLTFFTPQIPPVFALCSLPGQLPILRVTEARLLKLLGTSRTPTCLLDGSAR